MTIGSWLSYAQQQLTDAHVETARLDAVVLLEDALHIDRALLLAHPETELTDEHQATLGEQLQRRSAHEPLAYIRGKAEFYGREFYVDEHVLVPRPESEGLIEVFLKLPITANTTIIDVGCGSGCLAITAKLERPQLQVIAIDINTDCLAITRRNAATYQADVESMQGDLLQPLAKHELEDYILLCNLPYVPIDLPINQAAGFEPPIALFGGTDGLDHYRKLFMQIDGQHAKPRAISCESLPDQHRALCAIAEIHGYEIQVSDGFVQTFVLSPADPNDGQS